MKCLLSRASTITASSALMALLCSCASTGDWREDTIFFNPRFAENRLQPKREEIQSLNEETTAEQIQAASLRRTIAMEKASVSATRSEIRRVRKQKAAAEAELATVENALPAAQSEAAEGEQLRARRDQLRREVNRLDTLLADLLEVESQRSKR